jgi:N-acetyl-anhydromuramyl-L-alanine amidase AmpD
MSENVLRYDHLRSTRPRREQLRAIVLHWTGGTDARQCFRTLRSRTGPHTPDGLSVHYIIGSDGEVLHTASTSLVCLHAGVANAWSIGIEVVSPG